MSVETEILEALANDATVMDLLGSGDRIMSGNPEKRLPLPPPLLLVEALQGEPKIVGEEGIIVDRWICTIWILVEGSASGLEAAVEMVLGGLRFTRTATKPVVVGKPEMNCRAMSFAGSRMRG